MNVLVWQNNGQVRVMAAETPAHFVKIFERLKLELSTWGIDDELDALFEYMRQCKTLDRCVREFASFGNKHSDNDTFEVFEFTDLENA